VGPAALVRARVGARQDAHRLLLNRLDSPIFDPLRPALARLPADRWPTHAELTALAGGVTTSRGRALRFIAPREHTDRERRYYELHIAETGEVETRPGNWHDLFNALVWIMFPRAKATINAQHAAILEEGGEAEAKHRSPARDALTVFDEGGVIVAAGDPALTQLIVDFEWKELFWRRRAELEARCASSPSAMRSTKRVSIPTSGWWRRRSSSISPPIPPKPTDFSRRTSLIARDFHHRSRWRPCPCSAFPAGIPTLRRSLSMMTRSISGARARPQRKMRV
jgi:hypothetical protein